MKKNNGFTLVELLVVIAVSGLLLTVVLSLLLSGFESFGFGSDRAERQSDIRLVESIIHNELRNAMYVKISDLGSLDEDSTLTTYTIEFKNDALYQGGRKVTGEIFDEVIFDVISKNLFKLTLKLKNSDEEYIIKMFLNNFNFNNIDENADNTRKLSKNVLQYQKED